METHEQSRLPLPPSHSKDHPSSQEARDTEANGPPYVPVLGIEISIYSVPATSTCLLYVSKIDTTGLLKDPAPSKIVTRALLEHYMQQHPRSMQSLRIHVFARSQDQYLFPGSIENKTKRVLDDKNLCKWWRNTLGDAALAAHKNRTGSNDIKLFYLLGGYSFLESLPLVSSPPSVQEGQPSWQYGHPYTTIPPPLPTTPGSQVTINDLIPAFQDDPKSRYLTSLTSSPLPPAGDKGDYDDVMESLTSKKLVEGNTAVLQLKISEIEKQRDIERKRLLTRDVDEFWECMGGRQECCAGHVAGFFVVASDVVKPTPDVQDSATSQTHTSETAREGPPSSSDQASLHAPEHALSYATYVRLWSAIHNLNYASLSAASEGYAKWKKDIHAAATRESIPQDVFTNHTASRVSVDNPTQLESEAEKKRKEAPKPTTNLLVRKKKKTV